MTSNWWFPTAFDSWGYEELEAMARVIRSERFTQGPEVEAFEEEFAVYHDKRYAVMCNSGSSANLLMVEALFHINNDRPLKAGDVALVPALAWATTYAPLVQRGLRLVLVDCDRTWNADPYCPMMGAPWEDIKLVVGCSILGTPANLVTWQTIANVHDAYFIEDNCESLGAVARDGRMCGTVGLMSSSSFFWSHQLSAIEGGMVLTDDEHLMMLLRMLRDHGLTRGLGPFEGWSIDSAYDFRMMGYNLRGLELHAAIGREQLKKLPQFIEARLHNADLFRVRLSGSPVEFPEVNGQPSPFGLQFKVPKGTRHAVATALRAAGIDCRPPTGGSLRKHAYGEPWANQETPEADDIHDNGMFIGNAPFDISDKIERAADVILGAIGG